jgi:hypothetical protein
MAPPDPTDSGFPPKSRDVDPYDHLLNVPYSETPSGLNHDNSKNSLLKRDGSMNKLVEEKHLGPQQMIKKVNQQVAYN